MSAHEHALRAGHQVIGLGAGFAEWLGNAPRRLKTQKKLKEIRQRARAHNKKIEELENQSHTGEDLLDQRTREQELEQVRKWRNFLYYICSRVEEEWSDGDALEYLDKILAGDQRAVEPPLSRNVRFDLRIFDGPRPVHISPLEDTELWSQKTCVFLESEFNTIALQIMIWTRNLFDVRTRHPNHPDHNRSPRLYRRSKHDVSARIPSLSLSQGSTIQYPELLDLWEKLRPRETIDVVLRPADTRYLLILIAKMHSSSMPDAEVVVFDRIQHTIQKSIYERHEITKVFDARSWLEIPDKNIWGSNLKHNVNECPDYICCALAVA